MLLLDTSSLKNPNAHAVQLGCAKTVPTVEVYLPEGQFVWEVHESILTLLIDLVFLKNPAAHASHWGWAVVVPATLVYLPAGHTTWALQESVLVPLILKNPD